MAFGKLGNVLWSGTLKASIRNSVVYAVQIPGVIAVVYAQEWWHLWIGLALTAVAVVGVGIIRQQRLAENPFGPREFAVKVGVPGLKVSFKLVPWLLFAFALMAAAWAVTTLVYGDLQGLMASMFLLGMVMAVLAFICQSSTYQIALGVCWGFAGLAGLVGVMIDSAGWTLETAQQSVLWLALILGGCLIVWTYAFVRIGVHEQGISGPFGPIMSWDECNKMDLEGDTGRTRLVIERSAAYRENYEVAAEDVDGLRAFLELHVPSGTASNV